MGNRAVVETGKDRKALVADAGFNRVSFASSAAGMLTAYGAFALLAALAAGLVKAADVNIDVSANWRDLGLGSGLVVAGLLFLAYLFGGYVAGRMARRAGALHGALVFVLGLVVVALAALVARELGAADAAVSNLRDLGVPTTGSEWGEVASVAGLAAMAAMLLGAVLGGVLGERWHTKLLARALDPSVGAEAEAREAAERLGAEAEERRTASYERVRATAPTRTVRADTRDRDATVVGSDEPAPADRDFAHPVHPVGHSEADVDGDRFREGSNEDRRRADGNRAGAFWFRMPPSRRRSGSKDRS
jgi:hypothetical protein